MVSKPTAQAQSQLVLALASLLFWAWQTQVLWLGALLAMILLLVSLLGKRFEVDRHSCQQIGDLCLLIAVGIFAFYWLDNKASKSIFPTLRLLPIALFPLLLLQCLHQRQLIPRSALLLMQRKAADVAWIDMAPWFMLLCLLSAGAAIDKNMWYFPVLSIFLLVLMLFRHNKQSIRRKGVLVLLLSVVAGLALMLQLALVQLQARVETGMNQWLMDQFDHSQTSTAIGRVGRLKLSDEIVFRVRTADKLSLPLLLQTGSYQRYAHEQWLAGAWNERDKDLQGQAWLLRPTEVEKPIQLQFFQSLEPKKATLSIPLSSYRLQNLPAHSVRIEKGGSVVVEPTQAFVVFDVWLDKQGHNLPKVTHGDLHIAKKEGEAVALVAKALDLYQIRQEYGEKAVLDVVRDYFWREYSYSTWVEDAQGAQSPLADFLLRSHRGHCEYFATATVLLLREVGIAARYAVGYSMQEWDADHDYYVVRGRDAHAWALAWLDGMWVNVDNTPPDWFALEDKDRGTFQDWKDMWSAWMLKVKVWRNTESADNTSLWLVVLLVLFSFLAWRILRRVQLQKQQVEAETDKGQTVDDWLLLEQTLVAAGYKRKLGETLKIWVKRIDQAELLPLVDLYYVQRFHVQGLSAEQAIYLAEKCQLYRGNIQPLKAQV